jgi:hypothetical protein
MNVERKRSWTKVLVVKEPKRRILPPASAKNVAVRLGAQTSAAHVDDVVPAAEVERLKDEPADNAVEHFDTNGKVSPEKTPDLNDNDVKVTSVAQYANSIGECWYRGLTAMMEVARLCANASKRLTAAKKSELITKLPFGQVTFSKLVHIGTDTRLHTPDVRRLLPPHYTTIYAVTLLEDHELKAAITERVISPEMKRAGLQRWLNSRREEPEVAVVPDLQDAASNVGASIAPNAVQNQQEPQDVLRQEPSTGTPASAEDRSAEVMVDDAAVEAMVPDAETDRLNAELFAAAEPLHRVEQELENACASSKAATDVGIPPILDRRPLSAEDLLAFDAIMAEWAKCTNLRAALVGASPVVRERFMTALRTYFAGSSSAAG